MIIAGHGRVLAAKKLGIREIPVMTARVGPTRRRLLADNQLPMNALCSMGLKRPPRS
ncbi:hypothetical protein [Bradyrhizobium cenepequi]|uniref:hypothetical protein n=1 Tax=Bradyrhizobium cenepequi TaxID=2821403 RepID=UPI001CE2A11F|nr:hypothetical protein [Bradyrhizobium cenepequi]MCA6112528.1 hypothetical protein [Bradyrhizobium cenepequi]